MIEVIVFLGIQGSGKGTQAKLLADKTGYQHINIGDLFREQIAQGSPLGQQVKSIISRGDLVDDATVYDMVDSSLQAGLQGIIFDGFPRTLAQADFLMQRYYVRKVFYLDLSEAEAIARIDSRRICRKCFADYNLLSHAPKIAGICDLCGGEVKRRSDDTEDAIRQRVREFYGQTFTLIQHFSGLGLLKSISASLSIEEIQTLIIRELGL